MKTNISHSNKKSKIIKDYNSSSQYYDKRYHDIQLKKYKRFLEEKWFQHRLIFDAGCGTGLILEQVSRYIRFNALSKCKYVGVDISLNMLKKFQLKLDNLGKPLIINLILADLENLPIRENIADIIFCITVFQNLTDIERGLDNLIRVGKTKCDIVMSILKKALELEKFNNLVRRKLEKYSFENNPHLEDIIIWGTIIKEKI